MNTVISLLTCIAEYYICHVFFSGFLTKRQKYTNFVPNLIFFTVIVLVHFGVVSLNLSLLNLISFVTMIILYSTVIFEGKLKNKIIYIISICSISWGCEFLFMILLELPSFVMKEHSVLDLAAIPWHMFTLSLLKYLVCNIVIQFSKKSIIHIDNNLFKYYLCIPITSICMMFLTYYSGIDFSASEDTKLMLCIYFAIMQFGNILILYAFQKHSRELYHNVQQQLLITDQNMKLSYYNQMEDLNDTHKEFIHNTNHYIKTLGSLVSEGKNVEALDIISNLNSKLEQTATAKYSSDSTLNAILSEKVSRARKKGINIDVYVEPGTTFWDIEKIDIITMLCNLLDNAIEASEKCADKSPITVRIYMENQGNSCVTKIVNSHNGKLIRKGNLFVTTKDAKGIHGVGLQSVERTARKYNGLLELFVEDKQFTAVLILTSRCY